MNTVGVSSALKANITIPNIVNKFVKGADFVEFAILIKNDPHQVEEFLRMFIHRKKIPHAIKWNTLVALDQKHRAFELVSFDNEGKPVYEDEAFLAYVIKRSLTLLGIPFTHNFIAGSMDQLHSIDQRFNTYVSAMYLMKHFVKEFEPFLYSEFAPDHYSPEMLLQALSIVEETDEVGADD